MATSVNSPRNSHRLTVRRGLPPPASFERFVRGVFVLRVTRTAIGKPWRLGKPGHSTISAASRVLAMLRTDFHVLRPVTVSNPGNSAKISSVVSLGADIR